MIQEVTEHIASGAEQIVAGTGTSSGRDSSATAAQATTHALAHLQAMAGTNSKADFAIVLATGPAADSPEDIGLAVRGVSGAEVVVGCTTSGLFSDSNSIEDSGIAVLLCQGIEPIAGHVEELSADPSGAAQALTKALDRVKREPSADETNDPESPPLLAWILSPGSNTTHPFVDALQQGLPPATPVLGSVQALTSSQTWILTADGTVARDAVNAIRLLGAHAAWGLAQAEQPVGHTHRVTQASGTRLITVDGEPAGKACVFPSAPDQPKLLGVVVGGPGGRTHHILRSVSDIDENGALVLNAPVSEGDRVVPLTRDPETAQRALRDMLDDLKRRAPANPAFILVVDGEGRQNTTDAPVGLDFQAIRDTFPELPILGWRSTSQLAPVEGHPAHHRRSVVVTIIGH